MSKTSLKAAKKKDGDGLAFVLIDVWIIIKRCEWTNYGTTLATLSWFDLLRG